MKLTNKLAAAILVLCLSLPAGANQLREFGGDTYIIEQNSSIEAIPTPSVAVALGGGGARALVNIGVLRALEEANVPIDLVTGTSMGAVVAVLYGSGMPVDQMEELVTKLDLPRLFDINFPFTKSLVSTARLNHFLEQVAPYSRLEEFPIPTALLSFDLNSGAKYVHTTGEIAYAVQGPYAIPLCFPGQDLGDYYVVDAGIQELTPAQTARALGADVVIATTAFDELPYNVYDSALRSFMRLINLIKEDYSIDVVQQYSDIVVEHDVGDYSFMDFQLAQEFIDLGYRETRRKLPEIMEILAQKGVALKEPAPKYPVDMAKIVEDARWNRGHLDYALVAPRIYIGQDYSPFASSIFREELFFPHLGLSLEAGRFRSNLIFRNPSQHLEALARWTKLTPKTDLQFQYRHRETEESWDVLLQRYRGPGFLGFGLARLGNENFAHLNAGSEFPVYGGAWEQKTDVLWPLTGAGGFNFLTVHKFTIPLSKSWSFGPQLYLTDTDLIAHPRLYRGEYRVDSVSLEGSLNLIKRQQFPYSLEIMQIVQVRGIDYQLFLDFQKGDGWSYAPGFGINAGANLLGLKPSNLKAYSAFDLTTSTPVFGAEVSLTF